MLKITLLIFFLLLNNCGYQAINKIDNSNYEISSYKFSGNSQINKIIKKDFNRYKNKKNTTEEFDLVVKSNLINIKNSKNKAGEATNLNLKIEVELEILNNGKKLKNLTFNQNTNYNNKDNKFELKQFEKIIISNLTNKIINQIHLSLSSIK